MHYISALGAHTAIIIIYTRLFLYLVEEMDANKDGALECLTKARHAVHCGDVEKARRMAEKSIKLFPTKEAEGICSK